MYNLNCPEISAQRTNILDIIFPPSVNTLFPLLKRGVILRIIYSSGLV